VATGLDRHPVLLAVAYREVAVLGEGVLAGAVMRLRAECGATVIGLERLPIDAVASMVQAMTGEQSPELVELVHARTDGNPLFVRELVRLLTAAGGPEEAIPQTVRAMVSGTFGRLSAGAREMVAAAAVAGRPCAAARLAAIAEWDPAGAASGTSEAVARGLVVAEPDGELFRFSHDLVRESVYQELSAMRRARLHRRTGEILEAAAAAGETVPAADLAHHFVAAARSGGDASKAVRYAALAGEEATAALAYEEAAAQYERAVEAGAAIDAVDRTSLLRARGDARWRTGDPRGAQEMFLEAVHEAKRVDRPDLMVGAILGFFGGAFRPWHATRFQFGDRPARLVEEALELVGPADSADRAQLLGYLAEELYFTDDPRRFSLSAEAVEVARRLGDPETVAAALSSRTLAVWGPDHAHERRAITSELVEIAGALGRPQLGLFGLDCRFVAEMELGDMAAAEATLAEFETATEELRQPLYLWEARRFRTMEALFRGRFDEAEVLAATALDIGRQADDPDALAVYAVQLGMVRLEQGRVGEFEEDIRAQVGEYIESPVWRAGLALVLADTGAHAEARAELDRLAADGCAALPRDFAYLAGLVMLGEACWILDDADHAATIYDLLEPYADRNVLTADRSCWGSAARMLGLLATMLGRCTDAVEWFERAVDANRAMRSPPWTAYSQYGWAVALDRRGEPGDRERADELAASAAETATALGMRRLLDRLNSRQ
jgi:tetratricopeptide (TPR) repeat protein